MNVRLIEQEDIQVVRAMFLELYRHLNQLGFQYLLNEDYLDEYLDFQLNSRLSRILVGEKDGVVVGFVGISALAVNRKFISPAGKHYGLISEVFVLDDYRGKGLSKELIQAAEKFFLSLGITFVIIEALKENYDAKNLYEKLGFELYYHNYFKKL